MPKPLKWTIALVGVAAVGALLWWLSTIITPDELQTWFRGCGVWAPLAYIFVVVISPILFMPVAPLAMMSGLLFGLWLGYLYTLIGCVLNCAVMYWMTQHLGKVKIRRFLEKRLSPAWLARIQSLEGRTGFIFLIILRLTALIPYNVINYAFGLTNMKFRDFMLASLIGIVPDMLVYVNMGDKALDITSGEFWLALMFLGLFLILSVGLMWWFFPRSKGEITFTPLPGEEVDGTLPLADPLEVDELEWLVTTGAGTRAPNPTAGVREVLHEAWVDSQQRMESMRGIPLFGGRWVRFTNRHGEELTVHLKDGLDDADDSEGIEGRPQESAPVKQAESPVKQAEDVALDEEIDQEP